jgi:hypothetical protein
MKSLAPKLQYSTSTSTSDCSTQTPKGEAANARRSLRSQESSRQNRPASLVRDSLADDLQEGSPVEQRALLPRLLLVLLEERLLEARRPPSLAVQPRHQDPQLQRSRQQQKNSTVWLLAKLQDNHKRGQKVYFPAINRLHLTQDDDDMQIVEDDHTLLSKRFEQLCSLEEKLNQQAKTLKDDNEKLMKANNDVVHEVPGPAGPAGEQPAPHARNPDETKA